MRLNYIYFADKFTCTDEEKRECLKTVELIIEISFLVRKKGVLAPVCAENGYPRGEDAFLDDCVEYLCGGYEEQELREFYEKLLIAGNYSGKELLKNLLISEGLLMIAAGDFHNPRRFRQLAPLFGAGRLEEVDNAIPGAVSKFKEK